MAVKLVNGCGPHCTVFIWALSLAPISLAASDDDAEGRALTLPRSCGAV
jgi:hypothetical protein